MVAAVAPGKFYGSSLPRPRFYSDVKLNDERVDPPVSVMDPLLSWANDAHWSMGGLSFKRHRLQGHIEGSVEKLRAQQERVRSKTASSPVCHKPAATEKNAKVSGYAPQNLAALASDSSDPEEEEPEQRTEVRASRSTDASLGRKRRIRRLGVELGRIAAEQPTEVPVAVDGMASKTRSRRVAAEEGAEIRGEADAVSSAALSRKRSSEKKTKRTRRGRSFKRFDCAPMAITFFPNFLMCLK